MVRNRRDVLKATSGIAVGSMTLLAGCSGDGGDDGDGGSDGGDGGGSDGGGTGGTTDGGGGETLSLTYGHLAPLSGPFGTVGGLMENGTNLAVDQINESDMNVEIDVVHKDTQVTPDVAVDKGREAIQQDGADAVGGCASSSTGAAVSQFAQSQGTPYLATVPQSPALTGEDCNRMTFRTAGNAEMLMKALAITTNELTDGTRLAGIIPDTGATRTLWEVFSATMQDLRDVEIVNRTYPQFGAGDYQNEIQETINADPDVAFASMWGGDLTAFVQQAKGFDFFEQVPEFVASAGSTSDVAVALGDDMVEMIGLDRYFFQFPDTQRNQEFVDAYRNRFDEPPLSVAQEAYAGVYGLVEAIQASGGTSADNIVSGFEGLEWQAPEGPKFMRPEDHQVIEDQIWCGRIGPVDGLDFYGYTDMRPVDGEEVAAEPNCTF